MTLDKIAEILDSYSIKYKRKSNYIIMGGGKGKFSICVDDAAQPNIFPVYIIRDNNMLNMVMDKILMSM